MSLPEPLGQVPLIARAVRSLRQLDVAVRDFARRAFVSDLTGLLNRTAFDALAEDFDQQLHAGATAAFIDLTGFKAINDQHGYEAGNLCIATFAVTWQARRIAVNACAGIAVPDGTVTVRDIRTRAEKACKVAIDAPVVEPVASDPLLLTPPAAPSPTEPRAKGTPQPGRARERLRLARVVLDAGFPADSVRAASDALSSGIRALLPSPAGPDHAGLVAAI